MPHSEQLMTPGVIEPDGNAWSSGTITFGQIEHWVTSGSCPEGNGLPDDGIAWSG